MEVPQTRSLHTVPRSVPLKSRVPPEEKAQQGSQEAVSGGWRSLGGEGRPGPFRPAEGAVAGGGERCCQEGDAAARRAREAAGAAMEEFHPHNDEMTFNSEEANSIIKDCIEGVLAKADYNHDKVNQWTAAIVEQSLTQLVKLGKTYKYIVNCAIMQKCGAGLHTASSCFWDTTTDGSCTIRWENRTMNCVVNVFAVAIIL